MTRQRRNGWKVKWYSCQIPSEDGVAYGCLNCTDEALMNCPKKEE